MNTLIIGQGTSIIIILCCDETCRAGMQGHWHILTEYYSRTFYEQYIYWNIVHMVKMWRHTCIVCLPVLRVWEGMRTI